MNKTKKLGRKIMVLVIAFVVFFVVGLLGSCDTNPTLQQQIDTVSAQVYYWQNGGNVTLDELEAAHKQVTYLQGRIAALEGENEALLMQLAELQRKLEDMKNIPIKSIEVTDMIEFLFSNWHIAMSRTGIVFTLSHQDSNAVFKCLADRGSLVIRGTPPKYTQNTLVTPGGTVTWVPFENDMRQPPLAEQAYISIILSLNLNIVGYAVIRINQPSEFTWQAELLLSVVFPQINGTYQNVTVEQLNTLIQNLKNKDISPL